MVILATVFVLIGALLIRASFVIVPPGHIGVLTKYGRPQEKLMAPGLHVITPFVWKIIPVNVEPQTLEHRFSAPSEDYVEIHLSLKLVFVVRFPVRTVSTIRSPAQPYIAKAIDASLKAVLSEHRAQEFATQQAELKEQFVEEIEARLNAFGIEATEIYIERFGPDE
jgi:regulator of protease activity HflC (stomatin/prohibitin superfamily)